MRRALFALVLTVPLIGVGCLRDRVSYVPAASTVGPSVTGTVEGGKASTGGIGTTVTPQISTQLLVNALPKTGASMTADEPMEERTPVPLPDGTRAEYVSIARTYQVTYPEGVKEVSVKVIDTRGIPALYAFLDSFGEREDEGGYRRPTRVLNEDAWMTYAYGPGGEADGVGSLTMLFRKRFLIHVDGSPGVSAEALARFTERFDLDVLK